MKCSEIQFKLPFLKIKARISILEQKINLFWIKCLGKRKYFLKCISNKLYKHQNIKILLLLPIKMISNSILVAFVEPEVVSKILPVVVLFVIFAVLFIILFLIFTRFFVKWIVTFAGTLTGLCTWDVISFARTMTFGAIARATADDEIEKCCRGRWKWHPFNLKGFLGECPPVIFWWWYNRIWI